MSGETKETLDQDKIAKYSTATIHSYSRDITVSRRNTTSKMIKINTIKFVYKTIYWDPLIL